jgi:hypothetical protein
MDAQDLIADLDQLRAKSLFRGLRTELRALHR